MSRTFATNAQLGQLLHDIFIDIRNLSYEAGEEKTINQIADIAELIPLQLINPDSGWMDSIVLELEKLSLDFPKAKKYLAALNTEDTEIKERLCPSRGHDWGAMAAHSEPAQAT